MSRDIQQLLQACLDGFDGGLTPEECLSAYPQVRAELEPLFRQALSLRVAYAASPRPEFRYEAREKLLFAAGREVIQALASEPDPEFVRTTRQRLLNRAGATAQEALRDVPPPRLPFWMNARRRLLETASTTPPKPEARMPVGLRTAISAAVVVLAVAIAGAGFFLDNTPANTPSQTALRAELDYLSEQVTNIERQRASGESVSSSLLDDLAERTSKLAEQYGQDNPNASLLSSLPDLIQRQQTLLSEEDTLDETVANAQQRLDEADQRVAAAAPSPEPSSTPDTAAVTASTPEPTSTPAPVETQEPDPTPDIPEVTIISPSELSAGQIVWQYDASVNAQGLRWWRVTTSTMTFVMPEGWNLREIGTDSTGLAVLPTEDIFIDTDIPGIVLVVDTETGEIHSIDPTLTLRSVGGSTVGLATLSQLSTDEAELARLATMLGSVTLIGASPDATGTATPDATATETATPETSTTPATNP